LSQNGHLKNICAFIIPTARKIPATMGGILSGKPIGNTQRITAITIPSKNNIHISLYAAL
jgi:hypothetical protein